VTLEDITLPEALFKTMHHFAPRFLLALSKIHDPRNPNKIIYPLAEELLLGILLFVVKLESRRNIKFQLNSQEFIDNIKGIGKIFFPDQEFPDTIPHGDTLNYVLEKIPEIEIYGLRTEIIRELIRKKSLEDFRLLDQYYCVAIDGTGSITFRKRHCPHCLLRTHTVKNKKDNSQTKVTLYYHPVLEAKLILFNGLALSIATEFIENEQEKVSKQDCELNAFKRLAEKLKRDFPQLSICLLLDGLYAAEPVFQCCEQNHWAYLITFKEGSMPATFKEYESLKKISPENALKIENKNLNLTQIYHWVNDIDYKSRLLNVLECEEDKFEKSTRFVFLSSFKLNPKNVEILSREGRCRWIIENQGFNVQKNGGYGLEHAFSLHTVAMKNFYLLMQIAHIFNQLIEKGSLLRERIKRTMGSLKVFSKKLLASLTEKLLDLNRLRLLISQRIQIRFDSS